MIYILNHYKIKSIIVLKQFPSKPSLRACADAVSGSLEWPPVNLSTVGAVLATVHLSLHTLHIVHRRCMVQGLGMLLPHRLVREHRFNERCHALSQRTVGCSCHGEFPFQGMNVNPYGANPLRNPTTLHQVSHQFIISSIAYDVSIIYKRSQLINIFHIFKQNLFTII